MRAVHKGMLCFAHDLSLIPFFSGSSRVSRNRGGAKFRETGDETRATRHVRRRRKTQRQRVPIF